MPLYPGAMRLPCLGLQQMLALPPTRKPLWCPHMRRAQRVSRRASEIRAALRNPSPSARNGKRPGAAFQELQELAERAMVTNENMGRLIRTLYDQNEILQKQNIELLQQLQAEMMLKEQHLREAERRQKVIEELQEREQLTLGMVSEMQARLERLIEALSGAHAVPISSIEQIASSEHQMEQKLAVKLLEELFRDQEAVERYRNEGIPLAVKLLDSSQGDIKEKAALTLLALVTSYEQWVDEQACIAANRLGAGDLVTDMLKPLPETTVHASVLPLWNALTVSEMLCQN